jgi:outer membrane immunogenic protein
MKKTIRLASVVVTLVVAGSAQAADMGAAPIYRGPAPVLTPPSWTGFYLGAGVGLRASRADATSTSIFGILGPGTPDDLTGRVTSVPIDGTAFRASPYVGFNWQFAPQWIAGIEADGGFAGQTTALAGFFASPARGNDGDPRDALALKTTWDASLRGRLGFLLTPATLAYVTGGAAWQHYEVISTVGSAIVNPPVVTISAIRSGWTIGGGLETTLWDHWLARAEYRYADFGSAPFTIAHSIAGGVLTGLSLVDNFDVKLRTHTVTFGLAYKFN